MNNPFYYIPSSDCIDAVKIVCKEIEQMTEWQEEVQCGKMFGVLIAENAQGNRTILKAYSGQILGRADWKGWVPAVFDYLQPDGYFRTNEAHISDINKEIAHRDKSVERKDLINALLQAQESATKEINAYKNLIAGNKARRENIRKEGTIDNETLIRESQFEKAELKRTKQRWAAILKPLQEQFDNFEGVTRHLKLKRSHESDMLQRWLFSQFVMLNARGEKKNLLEIFGREVPPAGTGECCAPKLLQYAFAKGLRPISMAEFWFGNSPKREIRKHLEFYPACQGKCRPVLDFMLQGLEVEPNPLEQQDNTKSIEVLYEDENIIAVNKPAGMLSAPGKSNRRSVIEVLRSMGKGDMFSVHRLDMQTSGILVLAKNTETQKNLRILFEQRRVKKEYIAILDGEWRGKNDGTISLPIAPDYINRPRQCVDFEHGKEAVTNYHIEKIENGRTRVRLYPLTGRTHQLRIHCAHPDGFGIPIVGDDLYGRHSARLMLHAECLSLTLPQGQQLTLKASLL